MNKTSGNVLYPSWNSGYAGGEVSVHWKVRGKEAVGRGGAGTFIASLECITLAGSMVSDPFLGCSSLLKKILYNNNNMNISLFVFCFCFFFPFLLGIGVWEGRRRKSLIRLLGPEQRELLCG